MNITQWTKTVDIVVYTYERLADARKQYNKIAKLVGGLA